MVEWIPLLATLIGSGINMAGQGISNAQNAEEAQKNRDFQAAQAEKSNAFTLMMGSTQHQREVEDLKKAGLNPILSAGGSGAGMGSGAGVSGAQAQMKPVTEGVGEMIANTAMQMQQMEVQNQQLKMQKDANTANIMKTVAETKGIEATTAKAKALQPAYDLGEKAMKWLKKEVLDLGDKKFKTADGVERKRINIFDLKKKVEMKMKEQEKRKKEVSW